MNATDYLENKLIDHIFRDTAFTVPAALYVALFSTAPDDTSGGTELSGNGYARVNLAPSVANWKSTNGTTSGASSGTGGQTSNAAIIQFAAATGAWVTATHWAIFDASTGGNMLIWGALTASKTLASGEDFKFPVDALTVTIA